MHQEFILDGIQNLILFPFKDGESRNRLLIAIALGVGGFIIPIIPGLFVLGYAGMIMRQIIVEHKEPSMPAWTEWNEMLSLGFRLGSVAGIYALPVFVPFLVGYFAMWLPMMGSIMMDSSRSATSPELFAGMTLLGLAGFWVLMGVGILMSIVVAVLMPPALAHTVAKGSFRAGFRFREWWKILMASKTGFFMALLISGGLYMALMMLIQVAYLTVILCFVLPFGIALIASYLNIVIFVLFAQAYREGELKLEAGAEMKTMGAASGTPA
jgi:hypothetical protein